MSRKIERLMFVFDANSGKLSAFVDSAKKVLMIKGCSLCAITHGLAGEKEEWADCREEIGVPVDYFHRDDVPEPVAKAAARLPAIVAQLEDGGYELVLDPEALDRCRGSVSDLKSRLYIQALSRGLELPQPARRTA